jgi:hypothetical protein
MRRVRGFSRASAADSACRLKTLKITLNAAGRKLLRAHNPLRVRCGTAISGKTIANSTIVFVAPRGKRR